MYALQMFLKFRLIKSERLQCRAQELEFEVTDKNYP